MCFDTAIGRAGLRRRRLQAGAIAIRLGTVQKQGGNEYGFDLNRESKDLIM